MCDRQLFIANCLTEYFKCKVIFFKRTLPIILILKIASEYNALVSYNSSLSCHKFHLSMYVLFFIDAALRFQLHLEKRIKI